MKLKSLFTVCIFLLAGRLSAQQEEIEFGDISKADILMTRYEHDTMASAVILVDYGQVRVDPNSTTGTSTRRHTRIKFFNKNAFEEWGQVTLYSERNRLSKIKGATYKYDSGTHSIIRIDMPDNVIFKSRHNKFTDKVSFTLPQLSEGCIIEYSYTESYSGVMVPGWVFQYDIPVKYSEYLIENYFPKLKEMRGSVPLSSYDENYKNKFERFVMKNIPAFKEEPLMPDEKNYRSKVEFRDPYTSWQLLSLDLTTHPSFGFIVADHNYLKKTLATIVVDTAEDKQKIALISNYVKQNIEWNGAYNFFARAPSETLDEKRGDSGDLNLLLASLLYKAGIKVKLVLTSTQDHGITNPLYPSLSQFNSVLCMAKFGKDSVLLDATEKKLPYDILPAAYLNNEAMIIGPKPSWLEIKPNAKAKTSATANFTLSKEGILDGSLKYSMDGYAALSARKDYYRQGEQAYLNDFIQEKKVEIKGSVIQNMENYTAPVVESYSVVMTDNITIAGDFIYFNPYLALREDLNPFREESRTYPINFIFPIEKNYIATINLPDGYTVEQLPEPKIISLPDRSAKYSFHIQLIGNRLTVTTRLQQTRTVYPPEEYAALKEFYSVIVAKKSEHVVLKKK